MQELSYTRDSELIRRLSNGDEGAFLEFYRRHQGNIYRYALHMTGRPESAADIVQETFLTLLRNAGKFDQDKGAPAAFLYGIAHNHVRKLYEKEKRFVAMGEEEYMEDEGTRWRMDRQKHYGRAPNHFIDGMERAEVGEMLRDAVLKLPDHYREPITLCDLEGKSYSEAAALLECPVGTVRSRLNRARSILLEKLRPMRMGIRALGTRVGDRS